jgi:hypothetical protein
MDPSSALFLLLLLLSHKTPSETTEKKEKYCTIRRIPERKTTISGAIQRERRGKGRWRCCSRMI